MLLKADKVCFGYNKNKQILKDVSFEINSGEIIGIVAPSGFGKSTFAKILAGYLECDSGSVTIDGNPLPKKGFCPVQLLFQHPEKAVDDKWKMNKILNEAWNPSEELIKKMGIKPEWMNRWPRELSGGELQRFCILRALSPECKFLIADEMTTMLDVITQAQIWNFVISYCKQYNIGVIVISHEQKLLDRLCDQVVYLENLN